MGWKNGCNGNNSSGFTALAGGARDDVYNFRGTGSKGVWWSSSEYTPGYNIFIHLGCDESSGIESMEIDINYGFSVRCLKD